MPWTVSVPVTVDSTQSGTPEVRHLALAPGELVSPVAAVIYLGVRTPAGDWDPHVTLSPLRLSDDPTYVAPLPAPGEEPSAEPAEPGQLAPFTRKQDATDMINAVLTAKIDGTTPLALKFGIPNGMLLSEALPRIAWAMQFPPAHPLPTGEAE